MTKKKDKTAKRVAALEHELAELKGALSGKAPPKSDFVPISDAEWRDQMHQASERRMAQATPPSVIRDWNVIPDHIVKGIVHDRHAPTSPTGMVPTSQPVSNVRETAPSSTPGYVDPRPLSPPPGIGWVDAQLIADDVKQRAELARKLKG